jgi:hypothetical protein
MIGECDQLAHVVGAYSREESEKALVLLEGKFALMVQIEGQWQAKMTGGFAIVPDMLAVKSSLKAPSFVVIVE